MQRSSLTASISAAGCYSGEHKVYAKPVTFATVVDVGVVPIVLRPQLQITLTGEAKAEAAITTSATQSLAISSGLQWQRETKPPSNRRPNDRPIGAPPLPLRAASRRA